VNEYEKDIIKKISQKGEYFYIRNASISADKNMMEDENVLGK